MGRTTKIALAGALGGLFIALSVGMAMKDDTSTQTIVVKEDKGVKAPHDTDLRRCRTLTMPDAGCEDAWEARRRHFFGKGDVR